MLDFGSGAGFPGIPIAICRPEISVTLAESQGKKAAFLQEAVRVLGLKAQVHAARAETLSTRFDCVTLRAVDHMSDALRTAALLVNSGGWLIPMTSTGELPAIQHAAGSGFDWQIPRALPGCESSLIALGHKLPSAS